MLLYGVHDFSCKQDVFTGGCTPGCKGGGNFLIKSNFIWKGNHKNKNKIETKRDSNDEVFVYTTIVNIMTVF